MARNKREKKQPYYMISAVAEKFDVHPQTLRLYEREGLLSPSRTEGNTRVYTEEDLEQLNTILNLTREMGVNLAGVEVILNMKRKMELMQEEMGNLLKYLQQQIEKQFEGVESRIDKALIRIPPSMMIPRRPPSRD